MKSELDEALCRRYPKIFRDRNAPVTRSLMAFGCECGSGWNSIIEHACGVIQSHINWSRNRRASAIQYNRVLGRALKGDLAGLQWYHSYKGQLTSYGEKRVEEDFMNPQFHEVPDACAQVVAVQVKEKFGQLRFYADGGDAYTRGVLSMAEAMSYSMCEECGAPGVVRRGGWWRTLCDTHADELGYRTDEEEATDDSVESNSD